MGRLEALKLISFDLGVLTACIAKLWNPVMIPIIFALLLSYILLAMLLLELWGGLIGIVISGQQLLQILIVGILGLDYAV